MSRIICHDNATFVLFVKNDPNRNQLVPIKTKLKLQPLGPQTTQAPTVRSVVVVVVLTLTRIIKSVVTEQAPVTVKLRNTPEKKHKPKVVHAYITADAIHASARNI